MTPNILEMAQNRDSYNGIETITHALFKGVIDLEWLSEIFNDMKHRAASLPQLSFLYSVVLCSLSASTSNSTIVSNPVFSRGEYGRRSMKFWFSLVSNCSVKPCSWMCHCRCAWLYHCLAARRCLMIRNERPVCYHCPPTVVCLAICSDGPVSLF